MTLYLALAAASLGDAVRDPEAAKLQAQEMIAKYGKELGQVVILQVKELGRYEYTSPIWIEPNPTLEAFGPAQEQSAFGSSNSLLGRSRNSSPADQVDSGRLREGSDGPTALTQKQRDR